MHMLTCMRAHTHARARAHTHSGAPNTVCVIYGCASVTGTNAHLSSAHAPTCLRSGKCWPPPAVPRPRPGAGGWCGRPAPLAPPTPAAGAASPASQPPAPAAHRPGWRLQAHRAQRTQSRKLSMQVRTADVWWWAERDQMHTWSWRDQVCSWLPSFPSCTAVLGRLFGRQADPMQFRGCTAAAAPQLQPTCCREPRCMPSTVKQKHVYAYVSLVLMPFSI